MIIFSIFALASLLFIFLASLFFYRKTIKNSRILETSLNRSIQTININNLTEHQLGGTRLNKLVEDIQGVKRLLKAHDRQLLELETQVFQLFEKNSSKSLSSNSLLSVKDMNLMASSTVINDENIGAIFILDPLVVSKNH
jgi:hypothetical protein